MTIEEAIERYNHNAEYERANGNLQGCLEFRQLTDWLKDYKRLLEQEPKTDILDKIRAEIMDTGAYEQEVTGKTEFLEGINYCLSVIDKYKAESEE